MVKRIGLFVAFSVLFSACSVRGRLGLKDIPEDEYDLTLKDTSEVKKHYTVFLQQRGDTITLFSKKGETLAFPLRQVVLFDQGVDVDVFTSPFKFRSAINPLPPQLNPDFNGSIYVGYRLDRYRLYERKRMPYYEGIKARHSGVGIGAFGGVGSSRINGLVTNNVINSYEYDAFTLDYGLATVLGIKQINLGFAMGFDFLVDQNQQYWLYHNKPWMGVFIGLNLN